MQMAKKQVLKGTSLSLRIPEKIRYGLDLMGRSHKTQISALALRAIEDLLERGGLTKKKEGEVITPLDKLWNESESERIKALGEHAPMLMTPAEKVELAVIKAIESGTHDLIIRLHSLDLAWGLISPGISDTFADDLLAGNKEYPNTASLKKEVYEVLHPEL